MWTDVEITVQRTKDVPTIETVRGFPVTFDDIDYEMYVTTVIPNDSHWNEGQYTVTEKSTGLTIGLYNDDLDDLLKEARTFFSTKTENDWSSSIQKGILIRQVAFNNTMTGASNAAGNPFDAITDIIEKN